MGLSTDEDRSALTPPVRARMAWGGSLHWHDLLVLATTYAMTASGITVGYHRLFTHRSFETTRALRAVFAVMGSMAVEGPVIEWVSTHRKHHRFSDLRAPRDRPAPARPRRLAHQRTRAQPAGLEGRAHLPRPPASEEHYDMSSRPGGTAAVEGCRAAVKLRSASGEDGPGSRTCADTRCLGAICDSSWHGRNCIRMSCWRTAPSPGW